MSRLALVRHGALALLLAGGVLVACGSGGEEDAAVTVADSSSTTAPVAEPEDSGEVSTTLPSEDDRAGTDGPTFHPDDNPADLAAWGQVVLVDGSLTVGDRVQPYTLNSALFSDYAQKLRTVWLPDGSAPAAWDGEDVFDFPVGTVITKTFFYPRGGTDGLVARYDSVPEDLDGTLALAEVRLVETRILVHRESGWEALPYVWDEGQTAATLQRTGDLLRLTLIDGDAQTPFPYVVPNENQCAGCHATNHTTKEIEPIGPKARHLNLSFDDGSGPIEQLALWQDLELLAGVPDGELPAAAVWDDASFSLDDRARTYLDINCAHCHNSVGPADTSGLFLEPDTELGPRLGVCKPPIAAGTGTGNRTVGIHPGDPDESIFVYRMQTDDPGAMMPELGRAIVHAEGVELISEWIASLNGSC